MLHNQVLFSSGRFEFTVEKPNGCNLYIGQWKNDLQHGQGRCNYENGEIYNGGWNSGKRTGTGVSIFDNDSPVARYEGDYFNDER